MSSHNNIDTKARKKRKHGQYKESQGLKVHFFSHSMKRNLILFPFFLMEYSYILWDLNADSFLSVFCAGGFNA